MEQDVTVDLRVFPVNSDSGAIQTLAFGMGEFKILISADLDEDDNAVLSVTLDGFDAGDGEGIGVPGYVELLELTAEALLEADLGN